MYIEMKDYTKILKKRIVLENISLSVEKGEILGFLGRNASGKIMMLRAMAGLILPSSGEILINGQKLTATKQFPDSCALIIENMNFWPALSARQTLEILCSIQNRASDDDIRDALTRVGLSPDDKLPVRKFSLGMKQKLAIAQAIAEKPELILLDELTNSLDKDAREHFNLLIQEEKERGATIVMSSHIEADLTKACDRLIEIDEGKLAEVDHMPSRV